MSDTSNDNMSAKKGWEYRPALGLPASGIPAGGPGQGPSNGSPAEPPFPPGNAMSVRHGARSPRVYGELATQLTAGLIEDRPDLAEYSEAVAAWAQAEAIVTLYRRAIMATGPFEVSEPNAKGKRNIKVHESLNANWRAAERIAAQHRATLGLDPRSQAALAKERAAAAVLSVDLEAIAARGQQVIAAREAAGELPAPDLAAHALAKIQAEGADVMTRAKIERDAQRPDEHDHHRDDSTDADTDGQEATG